MTNNNNNQNNSNTQYTIADYLFDRVHEAGATDVFGVPGDFNLTFLDNVIASKKLKWVGNTNELNAGYTADGYARERGFSSFITTFGVGELSAVNATAGSFAEYAPVLHIVGAPSTELQNSKRRIHHTLGDGLFNHFMNMVSPITVARAKITPENAASEIDRVIRLILKEHRPGFILLSPDVARTPIYRPTNKLIDTVENITSTDALADFKQDVKTFIQGKSTALMADLMVHRLGLQDELQALVEDTNIPFSTLSWGKSLLNENSDNWAGIYAGVASQSMAKDAMENAECLIKVGVNYTDTTTAGFSQEIDPLCVVDLHRERASIGGKVYAPIAIEDSLSALHEVMKTIEVTPKALVGELPNYSQHGADDEPLRQDDIWQIIAQSFQQNYLVFAEQGTSYFGISDVRLPQGVTLYGQPMWGSIGYTLPACMGAGLASPEKRAVLLIGDGSALLTVQELAVMLREQLNPIIILINNDGYTVERAIHGAEERYNDIPVVNWQLMPKAFGANDDNCLMLTANSPAELKASLNTANSTTDKMVFLEVFADKQDIPPLLDQIANALTKASKK